MIRPTAFEKALATGGTAAIKTQSLSDEDAKIGLSSFICKFFYSIKSFYTVLKSSNHLTKNQLRMFTNDFQLTLFVLKLPSCLCVCVALTAENASKSERPDLTAARVVISGMGHEMP